MNTDQKPGLLNSWKEIANYLGRGVRTVQRWEDFGLPIRRLGQGPRAPVMATIIEIDCWMQISRQHETPAPHSIENQLCRGDLRESILRSRALRAEAASVRRDHRICVDKLITSVDALRRMCSAEHGRGLDRQNTEFMHFDGALSSHGQACT